MGKAGTREGLSARQVTSASAVVKGKMSREAPRRTSPEDREIDDCCCYLRLLIIPVPGALHDKKSNRFVLPQAVTRNCFVVFVVVQLAAESPTCTALHTDSERKKHAVCRPFPVRVAPSHSLSIGNLKVYPLPTTLSSPPKGDFFAPPNFPCPACSLFSGAPLHPSSLSLPSPLRPQAPPTDPGGRPRSIAQPGASQRVRGRGEVGAQAERARRF